MFCLCTQDYRFHENNSLLSHEDAFGAGKERLNSGDIPGAVLLFEAAVQTNPRHAEVPTIITWLQLPSVENFRLIRTPLSVVVAIVVNWLNNTHSFTIKVL